jgi:hypothetical protein
MAYFPRVCSVPYACFIYWLCKVGTRRDHQRFQGYLSKLGELSARGRGSGSSLSRRGLAVWCLAALLHRSRWLLSSSSDACMK